MSPPSRKARSALDIQNIETMLSVAEAGGFRKAANGMRLGQSAVSRRVQRLEDVLGVSMFERRSNGARLTAAGASFASQMRSILHDLDCAIDAAHSHGGATTGQLRIGIIASLSHGSLRKVVKAFLDSHEQVDLRIADCRFLPPGALRRGAAGSVLRSGTSRSRDGLSTIKTKTLWRGSIRQDRPL